MLADMPPGSGQSGRFGREVQLPGTFLRKLLSFIASELPRWRDRPERKVVASETVLTSQLCAHLNSAARHEGFDFVQFRTEEPDEVKPGRKLDLVPAPRGEAIWLDQRRHTDFDPLMPIECKRLPTPADAERDEREYVISEQATTGGIQRFKSGLHGAAHNLGAMIGYIQEETAPVWVTRVAAWIDDLVSRGTPGWTAEDHLLLTGNDDGARLTLLGSSHARDAGLPNIELHHMWIQME